MTNCGRRRSRTAKPEPASRPGVPRPNRAFNSGPSAMHPERWSTLRGYILCPSRLNRQDVEAVPTPVGVNPRPGWRWLVRRRCPHTRGGEPAKHGFPNRIRKPSSCPHTRGGEPDRARTFYPPLSSCPHTRGGEPFSLAMSRMALQAVPTPVGVNRLVCGL